MLLSLSPWPTLELLDGITGGAAAEDPLRNTTGGVPCLNALSARSSDGFPAPDVVCLGLCTEGALFSLSLEPVGEITGVTTAAVSVSCLTTVSIFSSMGLPAPDVLCPTLCTEGVGVLSPLSR